jgi:hypothetical protein
LAQILRFRIWMFTYFIKLKYCTLLSIFVPSLIITIKRIEILTFVNMPTFLPNFFFDRNLHRTFVFALVSIYSQIQRFCHFLNPDYTILFLRVFDEFRLRKFHWKLVATCPTLLEFKYLGLRIDLHVFQSCRFCWEHK